MYNCELIQEYLKIVLAQNLLRSHSVECYRKLDEKRRNLHEAILEKYNTTREDKAFNLELAEMCETCIATCNSKFDKCA